jgi:hypothetical protein
MKFTLGNLDKLMRGYRTEMERVVSGKPKKAKKAAPKKKRKAKKAKRKTKRTRRKPR